MIIPTITKTINVVLYYELGFGINKFECKKIKF